jgi:hypothetical protein
VCTRPQIEFTTRLYRQVEKATRKPPKVQVGKSAGFHTGKAAGKITFEQAPAEVTAVVFKPAPGAKTDALCLVPAVLDAGAAGSAGRR